MQVGHVSEINLTGAGQEVGRPEETWQVRIFWKQFPLAEKDVTFLVILRHLVLIFMYSLVLIQLLSRVRLFETPWTAACQASLSSQMLKNKQMN